MARELGLDPKRLGRVGKGGGDPAREVVAHIDRLYLDATGRSRPESVRSLEELAERLEQRKAERRGVRSASGPATGEQRCEAEGGRVVQLAAPVSLERLVQELVVVSDDVSIYLDKRTGEFVPVTDEMMILADRDPHPFDGHLEWEREAAEAVRAIEDSDRYLPIPDRWEIDQHRLQSRFAATLEGDRLREEFEDALRGRGAMRRFRNLIQRHDLERSWHDFESAALNRIAREWLEKNGLPFREDVGEE
jgi:hypothetical protein